MTDIWTTLKVEADACREMNNPTRAKIYECAAKEIKRLRELVYAYPPSEPFAIDGVTWQQEAERLRGLLIRIRDETVIDADLYYEICRLVGTGL